MRKSMVLAIALAMILTGWSTLLANDPLTGERTRVECYGKFKLVIAKTGTKSSTVYTLESEGRAWRLDTGTDRVINWVAARVDGKTVVVTGWLKVDDKMDTIIVTRIEPQDEPRAPAEEKAMSSTRIGKDDPAIPISLWESWANKWLSRY